jgi:phosphoribosylformylglycinamidine (FGAM) synthase PurS component
MFAQAILKLDELPPDPEDERVYGLNLLRQRGFQFVYEPGNGIERVVVRKMRLSSRIKQGDRFTVEADASKSAHAVYDLLDEIGNALPLGYYNVTQVEISATMKLAADKPQKQVTFRITYPNSCSLKYDDLDLRLRDMLTASGIEPKEPTKTAVVEVGSAEA